MAKVRYPFVCEICGESFERDKRLNHGRRPRFCSVACRGLDQRGKPSPNFKGGGLNRGYWCVYLGGKRVILHRWLFEEATGYKLSSTEIIHHEDENTLNNVITNLRYFNNQADHVQYHNGTGAAGYTVDEFKEVAGA